MGLTKGDTRGLEYGPYEPEPAQNPTFLQLGFSWLRFRVCGKIEPEPGMLSVASRGTLLGSILKNQTQKAPHWRVQVRSMSVPITQMTGLWVPTTLV